MANDFPQIRSNVTTVRSIPPAAPPTLSNETIQRGVERNQQIQRNSQDRVRQQAREQARGNDVSSLISPQVISGLINTLFPLAFGEQQLNPDQLLVQAALESTLARLLKEKANLIEEEAKLRIQHSINLQKIEIDHQPTQEIVNGNVVDIPPKLNDEEYELAKIAENTNYLAALDNIQKRKEKNQKDIDNIISDPFAKQKEDINKFKQRVTLQQSKTKITFSKSKKARRKAIVKNVAKSLLSVVPLLLVDRIGAVIAQNNKIGELVDKANVIIEAANQTNNPAKLDNAKLVRNNALTVIQNNEEKLIKINDQIKQISTYITVFTIAISIINTIANILDNLPAPTAPILSFIVKAIKKLDKILDRIQPIVAALSTFLPIISLAFDSAITVLANYKTQLLKVNGTLEEAATVIPGLIPDIEFGTDFPTYKGFKFALREDSRSSVRGNKRHFAVAIDTNNVDVLKSESSFTLDPNDLIEQLKLVIDRENLIA